VEPGARCTQRSVVVMDACPAISGMTRNRVAGCSSKTPQAARKGERRRRAYLLLLENALVTGQTIAVDGGVNLVS